MSRQYMEMIHREDVYHEVENDLKSLRNVKRISFEERLQIQTFLTNLRLEKEE